MYIEAEYIADFDEYIIPDHFVDYNDLFDVECITCGERYGSHYGEAGEQSWCFGIDVGTDRFVPKLKLKRPTFELPDELFIID